MINKYDPRLKQHNELQATLVCGEEILVQLKETLQPVKDNELSSQSWIITGPRGVGKSHLITLLYREILADNTLSQTWFPVIFPEELPQVDSMYRLLMNIFTRIFEQLPVSALPEIRGQFNQLKTQRIQGRPVERQEQKHRLAKEFFKLLKAAAAELNRKLILLIENLQYLFSDNLRKDDLQHLRSFMLEHPGVFIIIGTALTVFDQIGDYGSPFYHFFRIRSLENLDRMDMDQFLHKTADFRDDPGMSEKIRNNGAYLHTYWLLSGGNPRLVLLVYELLLDREHLTTRSMLEKIMELTPYFLDKTREESAQRRLILDALAQDAPAQTATEIALYINEDPRSVTQQLSRMDQEGWVKEVAVHGRGVKQKETFFTLRDYFYRIWYKMRNGGIDRADVLCLAELTVLLLDREELADRYQRYTSMADNREAIYARAMKLADDKQYMKNIEIIREESGRYGKNAEIEELKKKIDEYRDHKRWELVIQNALKLSEYEEEKCDAYFTIAFAYQKLSEFLLEIKYLKKILETNPDNNIVLYNMGISFANLKKYKEAIKCYQQVEKIKPNQYQVWFNFSEAYYKMNSFPESYSTYQKYLQLVPQFFSNTPTMITNLQKMAPSLFNESTELQTLLDEKSSPAKQLSALTRLLLLGRFTAVTDQFNRLLQLPDLPPAETKELLHLFQATLISLLTSEDSPENELKIILEQWTRLLSKQAPDPEAVKQQFLQFLSVYIQLAGSKPLQLDIIRQSITHLADHGIEISDILIRILKALEDPDSREAQKWQADPLFAEIVSRLTALKNSQPISGEPLLQ